MMRTERLRRLFQEGGLIVLGQVMMVVGSLVSIRILTEQLTPANYGVLSLGMSIATLVNQTILGPLSGGITRFYAPAREHGGILEYYKASRNLAIYSTGIIFILSSFVVAIINMVGYGSWAKMAGIAFLFAILSGYNAILSGVQSAARQRAIVAFHQGSDPWLRTLVAVGLIWWLGASGTVAMLGYTIATLLLFISQALCFRRICFNAPVTESTQKNWQHEIFKYSWPIGIYGIFTWMQLVSDRWALKIYSNTQEVGHYTVLYQLGFYPISLIFGMVMQFVMPIFFQRAGDATDSKRSDGVGKLSWYLTWTGLSLTGIVFIGTSIFHDLIFHLLVANEYRASSYLLPWMILSGGLLASGQSLASSMMVKMKTRELMSVTITAALIGAILNFTGAYWYGIAGVVGAGILFSTIYFFSIVALVNRVNK
jgi:O-antigen/teichoic acid export membrane protein